MKIRYLSDLHLEITDYVPECLEPVGEDLVVLAGDIGVGLGGIKWAMQAFEGREVVYVLGNHEFYHHEWERLVEGARAFAEGSNVHLLENESIRINGLTILGCSLWTDFALLGDSEAQRTRTMAVCKEALMDYLLIFNDETWQRLEPEDTVRRHEASVAWLKGQLSAATEKVLVVTHHSPTPANHHPRFPRDEITAAFHSDLDTLLDGTRIHAWISGHTHHSGIVEAGNGPHRVRVCSNQLGYPRERASHQDLDTEFSWGRCLEVGG